MLTIMVARGRPKSCQSSRGDVLAPDRARVDSSPAETISLFRWFLDLGIFGFGLSIDGKIGVGVFPNAQEVFVRFARRCVIARHLLRAAELKPGQRSDDMPDAEAGIVDQLLELSCRRLAIPCLQVGEPANVWGVHRLERSRKCQIVPRRAPEQIDGCRRIVLPQLDRGPGGGNEVMLDQR